MDLLGKTIELCQMYDIKPARSKGQNFLINEEVFDFIVDSANLTKDDVVLEVGPGLGFMTAKLAAKAKYVIAVELDDKLAGVLSAGLKSKGVENVEVVNQDVMELTADSRQLTAGKYKIVANLPYNITSVFLRKFLSTEELRPSTLVLMLQKEVAKRMVAKPGDMSLLALSVQYFADAEILCQVPAKDFYPAPEVDSAVIRIKTHPAPARRGTPLDRGELSPSKGSAPEGGRGVGGIEKRFFQLAKIGFSAKRKMLKNNLAAGLHIEQSTVEKALIDIGLNPKTRAEELSVEDWKKLTEILP